LPGKLRAPIGLAYLLARASDTIADTADAPAEVRLQHLARFEEMICTGSTAGLDALQEEIRPPDAGEQALIAKLRRCLEWLAQLEDFDRAEIRAVMQKIIRGQTLDLQRFARTDEVVALGTAAELEEYTYLVAGCVGEFWTRVCLHHLPRYSSMPAAELTAIGINYGKGLQLVNILRDLPADLRSGRCYLPAEELHVIGVSPAALAHEPAGARAVFQQWHGRAELLLEQGRRYIAALRPTRLRIGCFLPWYLGVKTLALLERTSPLDTAVKLKVPRSTVRAALAWSPMVAFSNAALARSVR
jgi:farnesyl-diphosphate farnesyltransferase